MPDATSRIADIPNGMETHYAFDGYGRVTSIAHRDGANVQQGWTYDLTAGGNVAAVTAQDGSKWAYEHDGRNRLTVAERYDTDGTTLLHRYSYTYDDGDNLLASAALDAAASAITTTAFAYNDANELVSQAVGGTNTSFAYDAWGRMTSKSDGTYSATYAYRYGDKLASVMSDFPSEGNASYQYDGAGKRRQRTGGGTTTRYRWDVGWNVLNEEDNLGNLARTHIMDSPLAEVAGILGDAAGANPATGAYRYYVSDHLGSTRGLYDGGKSALGGYEYSPYGELYANSGSVALEGLAAAFTGKPWDAAAQMYYFPYRWYSPSAARWLTRDPLGVVDGPNVYVYVRANPVTGQDPFGLMAVNWLSLLIFGGAVWGAVGGVLGIGDTVYVIHKCGNCVREAVESVGKMVNHPKWDLCKNPKLKPTLDAANFGSECRKNKGPCATLPKIAFDILTDVYTKGVTF